MAKKTKLIEPIPATMQEIVGAIFADDPKPRDPAKEKKLKAKVTHVRNHSDPPLKS